MKVLVSYTVSYTAEVEVENLKNLEDEMSDIDIPEGGNNNSRYIYDTFEPLKFKDNDGKWRNIEDLEFLA